MDRALPMLAAQRLGQCSISTVVSPYTQVGARQVRFVGGSLQPEGLEGLFVKQTSLRPCC
jgi:hypothetical protein